MKKLITILALFTASSIFAIDRFVNPNLSSGNGTTLFTNITSAVAASLNGDRIIVSSNTYNEATLTIDKSLKIIPQTAGSIINFNANIIIAGFPGMKLEILGFNLGIYSISSNPISNGVSNNRAKISIIQLSGSDVYFNSDNYEVNLLDSNITNMICLKYGNVTKNNCKKIIVLDEATDNLASQNKILITNNNLSGAGLIGVYNNDTPFIISNNIVNNLSIMRWNCNSTVKNKIINNNFLDNAKIHFSKDAPFYNITFTSNKFINTFLCFTNYGGCSETVPGYNLFPGWNGDTLLGDDATMLERWYALNVFCGQGFSIATSTNFPNPNIAGNFEWSYNGINFTCPTPNSSQPLSLVKIIGPINEIDGGNPNHDYYDIDLTINDRGINGGQYSQLNYNSTNPNNSKAFIFDLEMPTDLFPGQNINITAKGYHKN